MAARPIKILSLDGGGIRGIIPVVILAEIEKRTGKPISKLFDLIAGTSTGGIIALGLAKPNTAGKPDFSASDLLRFYEEDGKRVFSKSFWRRIYTVENLLEERYTSSGIETVLKEYFGRARLKDSLVPLIITAYEIERRSSFFFKSHHAVELDTHDFPMWQVARATSAAPTYFEPFKIPTIDVNNYFALIDGGVFANNPAMCAYTEAKTIFPKAEELLLVSLGTGELVKRLPYDEAKGWGLASWARPMLDVVFDGVSDTVDYQLMKLLPPRDDGSRRYYRFQARLDDGGEQMDDTNPRNIRFLRLLGEDLIRSNDMAIDFLCKQLTKGV